MFAQITQDVVAEGQEVVEETQGVVQQTTEYANQVYELLAPSFPKLLGALAILVVGWLVAMGAAGNMI